MEFKALTEFNGHDCSIKSGGVVDNVKRSKYISSRVGVSDEN